MPDVLLIPPPQEKKQNLVRVTYIIKWIVDR